MNTPFHRDMQQNGNTAFEFNKESMKPLTDFASVFLVSWFPGFLIQYTNTNTAVYSTGQGMTLS
jgi:hypothetical protein